MVQHADAAHEVEAAAEQRRGRRRRGGVGGVGGVGGGEERDVGDDGREAVAVGGQAALELQLACEERREESVNRRVRGVNGGVDGEA